MNEERAGRPYSVNAADRGVMVNLIHDGKKLTAQDRRAQGLGYEAVGRRFGVDGGTVRHHWREWHARSRKCTIWTDDELSQLRNLILAGHCAWTCSYRLGRTIQSVRRTVVWLRHTGQIALEDEPIHQVDVLILLGRLRRSEHRRTGRRNGQGLQARRDFERWVAAGALRADRPHGQGPWRTSRAAVIDFLYDERFWSDWNPFALPDPEWRREFLLVRGLDGYLTVEEIVRRYGLVDTTIRVAIRAGKLPAQSLFPRRGATREYVVHYLHVERHDWSNCDVPAHRGRDYGRLRYPPRVRPLRQKDHDARLADDVFGLRREGAA